MHLPVYLLITALAMSTPLPQAIEATVYHENIEGGYQVYADNSEYCPVTIEIDFRLKNMSSSRGNQKTFVLPPRSERVHLAELRVVESGAFSMNYNFRSRRGYEDQGSYDKKFPYYLPFTAGTSFEVSQGYNGNESHQGKKALDFDMPEGTVITAVRDGIVVELVEAHEKGCSQEYCEAFDNYVIVFHEDNTLAKYAHLRQNGVLVEVGDKVVAGQPIGESGSTGWAKGPHLHFSIYLAGYENPETVKTVFRTAANKPNKGCKLKEGKWYEREYQ